MDSKRDRKVAPRLDPMKLEGLQLPLTTTFSDLLKMLHLPENVSAETVKKERRQFSLRVHPDKQDQKNPDRTEFNALNPIYLYVEELLATPSLSSSPTRRPPAPTPSPTRPPPAPTPEERALQIYTCKENWLKLLIQTTKALPSFEMNSAVSGMMGFFGISSGSKQLMQLVSESEKALGSETFEELDEYLENTVNNLKALAAKNTDPEYAWFYDYHLIAIANDFEESGIKETCKEKYQFLQSLKSQVSGLTFIGFNKEVPFLQKLHKILEPLQSSQMMGLSGLKVDYVSIVKTLHECKKILLEAEKATHPKFEKNNHYTSAKDFFDAVMPKLERAIKQDQPQKPDIKPMRS